MSVFIFYKNFLTQNLYGQVGMKMKHSKNYVYSFIFMVKLHITAFAAQEIKAVQLDMNNTFDWNHCIQIDKLLRYFTEPKIPYPTILTMPKSFFHLYILHSSFILYDTIVYTRIFVWACSRPILIVIHIYTFSSCNTPEGGASLITIINIQ